MRLFEDSVFHRFDYPKIQLSRDLIVKNDYSNIRVSKVKYWRELLITQSNLKEKKCPLNPTSIEISKNQFHATCPTRFLRIYTKFNDTRDNAKSDHSGVLFTARLVLPV